MRANPTRWTRLCSAAILLVTRYVGGEAPRPAAEPVELKNALESSPATGPLRVHPTNPRYFADGLWKAIYLTGSHTWRNVQDSANVPDFGAFLDFLQRYGHNTAVRLRVVDNCRFCFAAGSVTQQAEGRNVKNRIFAISEILDQGHVFGVE